MKKVGCNKRSVMNIGNNKKRAKNASIQNYFDTERQEWRSFKKMNLVNIK